MFVKYIDENTIQNAPKVIFDEDKVYANPTEETLRVHGYLPYVEDACPEKEGFYYTYHYEADHDFVYKKWDEHEIIIEEPVVEEPDEEEPQEELVEEEPEAIKENEPEAEGKEDELTE